MKPRLRTRAIVSVLLAITVGCGNGNNEEQSASSAHSLDLSVSVSASPPTPCPIYMDGDEITLQIRVENLSRLDASGVVVKDSLPQGLVFIDCDDPATYDGMSGEWDVGEIGGHEIKSLSIRALIDDPRTMMSSVVTGPVTASLLSATPQDTHVTNNTATYPIAVTRPRGLIDLSVLASADLAPPVTVRYWQQGLEQRDANPPVSLEPIGEVNCAADAYRRYHSTLPLDVAKTPYAIEVSCAGRTGVASDITVCPSRNPDLCFRFGPETAEGEPCASCDDVIVP